MQPPLMLIKKIVDITLKDVYNGKGTIFLKLQKERYVYER